LAGDSFDADELAGRQEHKIQAAGLAPTVDVHAVVGLLFPDILGRFVLAGGQRRDVGENRIYAFSTSREKGVFS